eukprot:jgi/Phyca11/127340/e_gw1.68.196.1
MGDADAAQWNAVHEVFSPGDNIVFLVCFFHVAKKIYEKTRCLSPGIATSVMEDIPDLHFASSELDFHRTLTVVQGK